MRQTLLGPVGVEVHDVSIGETDAGQTARLRELLAHHGVVVLRDQDADDDAFAGFLRRFGPLTFTAGEIPVDGHPDLNVISNVGRSIPPRSTFHTDTSYRRNPPAYSALRAVTVPARGGATLFTNQYRAFDSLPADMREALAGRTMTHAVTGIDPHDAGDETSADHPVFRRHPVSMRTAVFVSTPQRCTAISGMGSAEAQETVRYLFEHSTRAENVHQHDWSPGDVVMWDNGCVLHRADHTGVVADRVLHRGMVEGYGR